MKELEDSVINKRKSEKNEQNGAVEEDSRPARKHKQIGEKVDEGVKRSEDGSYGSGMLGTTAQPH
jgi:hypothetical protein